MLANEATSGGENPLENSPVPTSQQQQVPPLNPAEAGAQQFCLRWNSYPATVATQLAQLRASEDFVDVTLACDGRQLRAHKLVLSACSPYFMQLFKSTPCSHPVIFLRDVGFRQLTALLEFMYAGEVNVSQNELPSLLRTAEALQVRGLADTTANNNSTPPTPPQSQQMQKNNFNPQYPSTPHEQEESVMPTAQQTNQMDHQQQQQNQQSQQQQQTNLNQQQQQNVRSTPPQPPTSTTNSDSINGNNDGNENQNQSSLSGLNNSSSGVLGNSLPPPTKRSRKEDRNSNVKNENASSNSDDTDGEFDTFDQDQMKKYINNDDDEGDVGIENLEDHDLFPGTREPLEITQGDLELGSQSEEEGTEMSEDDDDEDDDGKEFTYASDTSYQGSGEIGPNGENVAGPSAPKKIGGLGGEPGEVGKIKAVPVEEGSVPATGSARNRLSRSLWPPGIPYHGPQQCPYCPRTLSNVGNWRKHVLTMHFAREKVYKCQHCESSFRTAEYLQKHYVRVHNYPQKMTRRKGSEQT